MQFKNDNNTGNYLMVKHEKHNVIALCLSHKITQGFAATNNNDIYKAVGITQKQLKLLIFFKSKDEFNFSFLLYWCRNLNFIT